MRQTRNRKTTLSWRYLAEQFGVLQRADTRDSFHTVQNDSPQEPFTMEHEYCDYWKWHLCVIELFFKIHISLILSQFAHWSLWKDVWPRISSLGSYIISTHHMGSLVREICVTVLELTQRVPQVPILGLTQGVPQVPVLGASRWVSSSCSSLCSPPSPSIELWADKETYLQLHVIQNSNRRVIEM